jgi:hypothetical protein
MHKWLDVSDEAGQRLKYVLWGPGGVGKSTLALKFDAGKVGAAREDSREVSWSQHKALCIACVPKRNMDDVMELGVGSFAEDEACSWVKITVLQWCDHDTGVLEMKFVSVRTIKDHHHLVRYVGCLPLALGLASAHATEHNGKYARRYSVSSSRAARELLEYDAEAQRWAVELSDGGRKSVRAPNTAWRY